MKVLFATDGSASSHHAISEAMRLLAGRPVDAIVVGVVDRASGLEKLVPVSAVLDEQVAAQTQQALGDAEAILAGYGVQARLVERQGRPGVEILAVAEDERPDLIVVGSHGYGPFVRAFVGSVSSHVVHHWRGAVLVVRPEPEAT